MEDSKVWEHGLISLVIKTPNQIHGDQLVEGVNTNWTVKDLKTHLTSVYPSKPVGFYVCYGLTRVLACLSQPRLASS